VVRGEQFLSRPRGAFWTGIALVALVVLVGAVIPTPPPALDLRWSQTMHDVQTGGLHDLALAFNSLGRGLGRTLSLAAVGLVLIVARRWRALLAFALVESLTPLAVNLLKQLVDRPRPPGAVIEAAGSSFPSGHAAYAGATAVSLVLLFTRPGGRARRVWAVPALLVIAAAAWSRTYLQVHWLTDAVSGAILGVAIALVVFAAAQRLPRRRNTGA
jgi:membrane-associated phospholipid phosphatase